MFSLEQLVNFPTHESASGAGAALDLVITDIPHAIDDLHAEAPMGQSDHCVGVGKIKMSQSMPSHVSEHKQLPHRSNLASLNISSVPNETAVVLNERQFHIDWEAVLQLHRGDPSLSADMLYNTLEEILQSYLERRKSTIRCTPSKSARPPCLTPALREQIKRKRDSYSVYRKYQTPKNQAVSKAERQLQRGSFSPLVFSSVRGGGGAGGEARNVLKRLAIRLAAATGDPYSVHMGRIRCELGFTLVRDCFFSFFSCLFSRWHHRQ